MSVRKHTKFLQDLGDQRPDSVLRERRIRRAQRFETHPGTIPNQQPSNPYVKVAVWTLTASLGTVALYVLSSAKRWI